MKFRIRSMFASLAIFSFTLLFSVSPAFAKDEVEQTIKWKTVAGNPVDIEAGATLFAGMVNKALSNSSVSMRVADIKVEVKVSKVHGYAEHEVKWEAKLEACKQGDAHRRFSQFGVYASGDNGHIAEETAKFRIKEAENVKRGFRKPKEWSEHKSAGNEELKHWCYMVRFYAEQSK